MTKKSKKANNENKEERLSKCFEKVFWKKWIRQEEKTVVVEGSRVGSKKKAEKSTVVITAATAEKKKKTYQEVTVFWSVKQNKS